MTSGADATFQAADTTNSGTIAANGVLGARLASLTNYGAVSGGTGLTLAAANACTTPDPSSAAATPPCGRPAWSIPAARHRRAGSIAGTLGYLNNQAPLSPAPT